MDPLKPGAVTMAEIRAAYPALAALAEGTLSLPRLDPETAEWLDGPYFVRWLFERGLESTSSVGDRLGRRIREWQAGAPAPLARADEVLTLLGLHLSEIPDEMWIREPRVRNWGYTKGELRDEALRRVDSGEPLIEVARDMDIHPTSIRNWRKAA